MKRLYFVLPCMTAVACGSADGQIDRIRQETGTPLVDRHGAIIADGCELDGWQRAVLRAPATKKVVDEVILLCGTTRESGDVGPADPSSRAALDGLVAALRTDGYAVRLGISFTDETGQRYDGSQIATHLSDAAWVAKIQPAIVDFASHADGIELDVQRVSNGVRSSLSSFVAGLSGKLRPSKTLGVFLPPSGVPGADAFDVQVLATYTDRLRVMTLDYSDTAPGPTLDPGWAVDVGRAAASAAGKTPVDVSVPLYGTDFSSYGTRPVSYVEAMGWAAVSGAPVQRGPTLAPHVEWRDGAGVAHSTWFDDRTSTVAALEAWDEKTLPPEIGVVYYGFGAEDPTLWDGIAKELR